MTQRRIILGGFMLGTVIAAVLFVVDANRKTLRITWHPGETSVFIDPLYPPGRWEKAKNGQQVMKEDPAYTDVLIPRKYQGVVLAVRFENPDTVPVAIGFRTKDGGMDLRPAKDGVFESEFRFADLQQNSEGRAQVIFSVPKLREGARPIVIEELTVTYMKE